MALVDYSDSDGSEEQYTTSTSKASVNNSAIGPLKRKRDESVHTNLPPLPSSFHDLYASNARVSTQDDPGLHGGRPRAMPHVEGNWPTHAYIEWYPSETESEHLSTLLASLEGDPRPSNDTVQSLLKNEVDAEMPLHVSLSRPLVLATDQRSPFVGMLKDRISRSGARPFCIGVRELEWVSNDEKTRWFLVLKLTKPPNDDLNKLLHVVNQAASSFGKALLYAEPRTAVPYQHNSAQGSKRRTGAYRTLKGSSSSVSANPASDLSGHFHMSIGWSLNAPNSSVLERSRSADLFNIHNLRLVVQAVKVKVGNAVTSIPLPTRMEETRGIIES